MNVLKYAGACVFVIQIKMVNLSLKKFFKKMYHSFYDE